MLLIALLSLSEKSKVIDMLLTGRMTTNLSLGVDENVGLLYIRRNINNLKENNIHYSFLTGTI